MPLHVQRQVVGAREGTVAQVALEGPVARVLAVVAREFVGARELPAAAVPVAVVGLLACREGGEIGPQFASQGLRLWPRYATRSPRRRLLGRGQPTPNRRPEAAGGTYVLDL